MKGPFRNPLIRFHRGTKASAISRYVGTGTLPEVELIIAPERHLIKERYISFSNRIQFAAPKKLAVPPTSSH